DRLISADVEYTDSSLLSVFQDENMISFIKGGIKIRTSYQIYNNSCCVLQEFGLSQLRDGAGSHSLRSILCVLTLLLYHTYVCLILGTGEGNLVEAEALLEPYIERFPRALVKFQECISAQQQWRQIHHLCYWELMWCHSFQQQWREAYRYADLLCRESRWSKAIYMYQKAAILSMMSEEELKTTGEDVVELFRQVEGLKQRLAGKSIPTEKFAIRKSRRYTSATISGLMDTVLIHNIKCKKVSVRVIGFIINSVCVCVSDPSEFHPDDQCLVQMLKGLCLKYLGRLLQAELCFTQVLSSEKLIRYDHYLIPFTLYELGLLYKQQGNYVKATRFIEDANSRVHKTRLVL
uniref:Tetratricopeptide repeat protein 39B n=1 Tax=Sinocyclocheilus grahami TaxID=75366 RepID=A0A672NIZ0_SINGR